jgi:Protein of unknown function (DUF3987)
MDDFPPFSQKLPPDLEALINGVDWKANGHGAPTSADWPEPDWEILDGRRGNLPEFPDNVFPPEAQAWLERASHGAGVTTAHVAVPFLGIVSSLIGISRCIHPARAWPEPCTMWMGLVGFSGTGKTPGIDVTKRALAQIQKDRKDRIVQLQLAHETRVEAAKAASKKWRDDVETAIEDGQPPPVMPASAINPGPFIAPRLYVSDATIQRLAMLLASKPRGQLVIIDELAGLFLNMARYANGGQDNEFWLEAWNGKSFICERIGRPSINVDHLLVGLVGGFQPDKLEKSFGQSHDGMYARLCFSWPAEPDYRPLSNEAFAVDTLIYNVLVRIIDLPADEDGVFASRKVELSDDAIRDFEHFRQFLHHTRKGLEGREREWFDKTPSHVLRLAGTLTFINWAAVGGPEPTHVDVVSLQDAVRLVKDYFWPHSRAALRQIGLTDRHADARRVLKWAIANRKTELSVKDVRRVALSQSVDAKGAETILDTLVDYGFLQKEVEQTGKKGRPTVRWPINPKATSGAGNAENAENDPFNCVMPE